MMLPTDIDTACALSLSLSRVLFGQRQSLFVRVCFKEFCLPRFLYSGVRNKNEGRLTGAHPRQIVVFLYGVPYITIKGKPEERKEEFLSSDIFGPSEKKLGPSISTAYKVHTAPSLCAHAVSSSEIRMVVS